MTFNEALNYAIDKSDFIRSAYESAEKCKKCGLVSPSFTFSIGDEAFTFYSDGISRIIKVKHNPKRATWLITTHRTEEV